MELLSHIVIHRSSPRSPATPRNLRALKASPEIQGLSGVISWSNDSAILTLISRRLPMAAAAGVLSFLNICGVLTRMRNNDQPTSTLFISLDPYRQCTFLPFPLIDTSYLPSNTSKKKPSAAAGLSPPILPKIRLPPSMTTPPSSQPRNSFTETDYYRKTREEIYSPLSRAQLESSYSGSPVSIISFPLVRAHAGVYPVIRPIHGSRR
ncbi:hypothetical protein B0H10DRAFT_866531 [Mycena sp. CBHHK59/15]|nr:hypothetical protein B0H10DRAFT_866531 [Mycena sp. CBHHK59/15]